MPKLFASPAQLIANAIAFFLVGWICSFAINDLTEFQHSVAVALLTTLVAWALYNISMAPRLDWRPITMVFMLIVGLSR